MALEQVVEAALRLADPPLVTRSARTMYLCLPLCVDEVTAREAYALWARLSSACHQHAYELTPTAAEVGDWVRQTRRIVEEIVSTLPATRTAPAARRPT